MDYNTVTAEEISVLIEGKQFKKLRGILSELIPEDISIIIGDLPEESLILLFRLLPKELAADVFVNMDAEAQEKMIEAFSDTELSRILDELYADDTVDIMEEMPANVVDRILRVSPPGMRATLNQLLSYPSSSAGSMMTVEYVNLKKTMTVEQAFASIRRTGIDKETVYTCYVTENRVLLGVVSVRTLLLSDPQENISDIMETNIVSAHTHDDREDVTALFKKYSFIALPVVDSEGRMVGIITVDDVLDVYTEEVEEDFAMMAAVTPGEKPYLKTSAVSIWLARIPWLLFMMVSATFTGMIITSFENALAAQTALVAFIPMLMGTGGNSGSQASVTIIRGISLGEIGIRNILQVVWKEFRVSLLCGVSLAVAAFVKILLIDNALLGQGVLVPVAAVVCITLAITVFVSKLIGCVLPLLAKAVGFDPAVMASPLITTVIDAVSLLVYFMVASAVLSL